MASRVSRLAAVLVDSVAVGLCFVPVFMFTSVHLDADGEFVIPEDDPVGALALLGAMALIGLVQFYFLWSRSQSLGKMALRIRIEEFGRNRRAGVMRTVLLRYILVVGISMLGIFGFLFALLDTLFIFGQERRCIHDLMAGTVVKNAP